MTYNTEGDDAIRSIADLVEHDFDGSDSVSSLVAKRTLQLWHTNSAAARQLIDEIGIKEAVEQYQAAWDNAFKVEYQIDDEEES